MANQTVAQAEFTESTDNALHYFKTLVEVARESFLILNSDLRVISANDIFYRNFGVTKEETENILLYHLGNGQWDIPELKDLLEKILPEKKAVRDYAVTHIFEVIGRKTILLNARQIDSVQLIILAMEDITSKTILEEQLADLAKTQEVNIQARTLELADRVKELESLNKVMVGRELRMVELKQEISELKKVCKDYDSCVKS